jgi:hypothetical protein
MPKPNATELLERLTPRVLAAADRHQDDRDLRAAVDLLATRAPAPAATDDYYAQLAANLHEVAERIASLAGTGLPRIDLAHVFFNVSSWEREADRSKPVVDALARVFDAVTKVDVDKYSARYLTDALIGGLVRLRASTDVPRPAPRKGTAAQLREENERLRAELARRDGAVEAVPVPRSVEDGNPDAKPVDHDAITFPAGRTVGGAQ